jgi:thiamine biosynthesis lipoprotein
MGGAGKLPEPEALAEARSKVGMRWIELNKEDFAVRFGRTGMMLDLGAIGKGYAVERAAELLREAGVMSALINGGTSTIYALGEPPGEAGCWKVAIEHPAQQRPDGQPMPLATVELRDEAMSVSAAWGKSFQTDGKTFGHVLDPRTGQPAAGALLAAVGLPSATETDALSTALLIAGESGHEQIGGLRPNMRTLIMSGLEGDGSFKLASRGMGGGGLPHRGAATKVR